MAIDDPLWPRADAWLAQEASEPDIVVVGVPSSSASLSLSRADLPPGAVRERMGRFSTFDGEREVDFAKVRVADLGNWAVSDLRGSTTNSLAFCDRIQGFTGLSSTSTAAESKPRNTGGGSLGPVDAMNTMGVALDRSAPRIISASW